MITTEDIADLLELTGKLLELHNENPFKVRAINNAAYKLGKTRLELANLTLEKLCDIDGVSKGLAEKILAIIETGTIPELLELKAKTPEGVIDMLDIKGLGPKKVRLLWDGLQIESVTDLLYACHENRLIELKGFGVKTQQSIIQNIEFKLRSAGKFHYAYAEKVTKAIISKLLKKTNLVSYTGAMYRKCEIIDEVDILIGDESIDLDDYESEQVPLNFITCSPLTFYKTLVETSSTTKHLEGIGFETLPTKIYKSEKSVYDTLSIQYCAPEIREGLFEIEKAKNNQLPKLITDNDLTRIFKYCEYWLDCIFQSKRIPHFSRKGYHLVLIK